MFVGDLNVAKPQITTTKIVFVTHPLIRSFRSAIRNGNICVLKSKSIAIFMLKYEEIYLGTYQATFDRVIDWNKYSNEVFRD